MASATCSTRREPGFAELLRAILGAALRLQPFDLSPMCTAPSCPALSEVPMKHNVVLSSIAVASLLFFQACSRNEVSSTSKRDDAKSGLNDKNQDHSVGPPPTHFAYFEIYEGNDGKTHFRDVAIDLELTNFAPPAPPLGISKSQPASHIGFAGAGSNWGRADHEAGVPHPTPKRQFYVNLSGTGTVITTDGDRRKLEPGTVVLLTDVPPSKGHFTIGDDKPSVGVFVQLE